MEFSTGAISLDQVTGGFLAAGLIPLDRLTRERLYANNVGGVTVLAAQTDIVSQTPLKITEGDVVLVIGQVRMTKGGTSGLSEIYIDIAAGVGGGFAWAGGNRPMTKVNQATPMEYAFNIVGVAVCTATDVAPSVYLRGTSAGSNGAVAAGQAALTVLVIRGTLA